MGEGTPGSHWIGCWVAFRVGLDVGWPSELGWMLGGLQSWAGCWVSFRAGLDVRWPSELGWMLGGLQSWAGCWVAFRVGLDALQLICEPEI